MTSIFKIATMALVGGVLSVAVVAQATDFTWDANSTSTSWVDRLNWDPDTDYPNSLNDNAFVDAAGNLCTFDSSSNLSINALWVAGSSPTWRKLHIKDAELTVANAITLGDYGELDVDDDLTIAGIDGPGVLLIERSAKVDIASNITFFGGSLQGRGSNAQLTSTTAGTFQILSLGVDANTENAPRALKLIGGTIDLGPQAGGITPPQVVVVSDPDGNGRGKLWVASTTLNFTGAYPASIYLVGGDDVGEEAQLDLDVSVSAEASNSFVVCTGLVDVDIAANKTFSVRRLIVGSGAEGGTAVVTLTAGLGAEWKVDIVD